MRDWTKTLRRASFRGVSFWVEAEDLAGGKRLARHEYAGGRTTYLEEMGLATPDFSVTAYLVGDDSDARAILLTQAAQTPGPGRLVLPMDRGQMAYVEGFRRSRSRDRAGYIAFDFTAIPLSTSGGSMLGVADMTTAVLSNLSGASAGFGGFF
ncbi:DNA circularization N-terminal domain-containing protein [Shinella zoogloeoides]|uniref:DNA circularization N-terminal domain-containing protein n=1 Tax=Shinella zoogloeoides TaxID=352475 RepID=UPI00273D34C9|nr:DNA circularization N-terminal domain-containing protein [Shinella zoogloeoides]WLR92945.1 DNA circularization N-terminal domain-containing protein [Shinella zoogloeoides]